MEDSPSCWVGKSGTHVKVTSLLASLRITRITCTQLAHAWLQLMSWAPTYLHLGCHVVMYITCNREGNCLFSGTEVIRSIMCMIVITKMSFATAKENLEQFALFCLY
jgi:hypothetical protein